MDAPRKHIWVVTGPAGCGKTTIALDLAKELQLPYIEGDDVSLSIRALYSSIFKLTQGYSSGTPKKRSQRWQPERKSLTSTAGTGL